MSDLNGAHEALKKRICGGAGCVRSSSRWTGVGRLGERAFSRTSLNFLFDLSQWDHSRGGVGWGGWISGVKRSIWTGLLVSERR